MREEQIFAKTLEELSALAKEQGNMLSEEQVTEAFDKAKLNLGEPQLEMIFAYLKNKKIGIGQPADPFDYMTQEEIDYLEEYLKAVQAGVPKAQAQLTQIDQMLEAAQGARNAQSQATFGAFIPSGLKEYSQRAKTERDPPKDKSAAKQDKGYAGFNLNDQVRLSAKSKIDSQTLLKNRQRELFSKLTPERIQAMSPEEIDEMISLGLSPLLKKDQQ